MGLFAIPVLVATCSGSVQRLSLTSDKPRMGCNSYVAPGTQSLGFHVAVDVPQPTAYLARLG